MPKTITDSTGINRLISSKEYCELQTLVPEFNLFSLLDNALSEPAWSRIFAGLLDSTLPHGLGTAGLCEWLALVAAEASENASAVSAFVSAFPEGSVVRVTVEYVTRAGRRIDILVRVRDSKQHVIAAIGIENKLESPEQPAQISDYQAALSEAFPKSVHRLIVYLTPDRREARTASAISECPYVPASYGTVVGMCRKLAATATPEVGVLLKSLSREIETVVLGLDDMKKEAMKIISRLWLDPDHRKALRLIAECLPTLRPLLDDAFERRISQGLNAAGIQLDQGDDGILYWPPRSTNPREIQVYCGGKVGELTGRFGFYLCYMLHCPDPNPDSGSEFTLRLMAWCESSAARQRLTNLRLSRSLPPSGGQRSWGSWENIWTGGCYCLLDLGERDLDGLADLLLKGVRATFPAIAKAIGAASAPADKREAKKKAKK